MKKKAAQPNHDKSLKTFYLYVTCVILLIFGAIVVRGIILFQQNVFNPSRHFTLVVSQKGAVREIISFNPQVPSIAVLKLTDKTIQYATLAKEYGITSDGYMQVDDALPLNGDITALMFSTSMHLGTLQTNMTIFDTLRLCLLSKNVATNNEITREITLHDQSIHTDAKIIQALTDPDIASESVSIQIINASNITGMGQRLGKVLTNMGANVVDVSSSQSVQNTTTLAYYGGESVTLDHLQKLLQVRPKKLTAQPIADIVITIGTDKSQTTTF